MALHSLSDAKKELQFLKNFSEMLETLMNVSVIQYNNLDKTRKKRFDEFLKAFHGFFDITRGIKSSNPLVTKMSKVNAILVINSNMGLMGGLNNKVVMEALKKDKPETLYLVSGEKGEIFFIGKRYEMMPVVELQVRTEQYLDPEDNVVKNMEVSEVNIEDILKLADIIIDKIGNGEIGSLEVMYPASLSFTKTSVESEHILPCEELLNPSGVAEGHPNNKLSELIFSSRDLILESSYEDIITFLVREWLVSKLIWVYEESKLAEYSARAVHLSGSNENLKDEIKKIKKVYNDLRKDAIDKQLREISAAVSLHKKKKLKKKKVLEFLKHFCIMHVEIKMM